MPMRESWWRQASTVDHVCHDGMIHNFHAMGAILPQGRLVLHQIGEQVRRVLGGLIQILINWLTLY